MPASSSLVRAQSNGEVPSLAVSPSPAVSLSALQALLPASCLLPPALLTGLASLDAALSAHGVPRGRLTEILGPRGSGKTTLIRELVMTTVARGLGVAVVDAARTLAPRDWARVSARGGECFRVVRPRDPAKGAWCADVLLRSGAFSLVVLDGAPPLSSSIATRLTRLARDANAALVVVGDGVPAAMLAGALRLRIARPRKRRRRTMVITVERGGRGGRRTTVEVEYVVSVAHRVCAHPEVPDRRGVARSGGKAGTRERARDHGDAGHAVSPVPALPPPRVLPRKRRCAEPDLDGRLLGAMG